MAARSASNSDHLMAASWELTRAARSAWMTEYTTALTMAAQMVIGMVVALAETTDKRSAVHWVGSRVGCSAERTVAKLEQKRVVRKAATMVALSANNSAEHLVGL